MLLTRMMSCLKTLLRSLLFGALLIVAGQTAYATEPAIPNHWDEKEILSKPDLSGLARLRFLTTTDFPPFNFLDGNGRLTGFHIELARALCRELDIVARCQIQALPWDELDAAIAAGQGEALIAGTAISQQSRDRYVFSRPYLFFPARFIVPKKSPMNEPIHATAASQRIGVLAGSAHEAMFQRYFPAAQSVAYSSSGPLYEDLQSGKLDGVFGDGMQLSFWLEGSEADNCCRFAGGPYLAPEFLGQGLAIAASRDHAMLAQAFDQALREITIKGIFAELYLKYFPVSFY